MTNRVTPGREGYKILFAENTVIINHKFAAAAAKYGTKEIVYIGKGRNMIDRIASHYVGVQSQSERKYRILGEAA